jgi:hypothetical protein
MKRTIPQFLLASAVAFAALAFTTAQPASASPTPPPTSIDTMNTPRSDWSPPDDFTPAVTPRVTPPRVTPNFRPPTDGCGLRDCIIIWAQSELSLSPRNRERASNCNFYSGWWGNSGDASSSCGSSDGITWRMNNWCSDFARYVWANAGGNTSGLDPWAGSFYRANKSNGRYHARSSGYVPQRGDAVVYDWDGQNGGNDGWGIDHVGIVESYSGGQLTTIEGNTSPTGANEGTYRRYRNTTSVVGYITP